MPLAESLILGCATPVSGRMLALRSSIERLKLQTVRPNYHALFAYGTPSFDLGFVNDLLDSGIVFRHSAPPRSLLSATTEALKMLSNKRVDLFFYVDADHVYRSEYIASILRVLEASSIDLREQHFCAHLVNQEWISSDSSGRSIILPHEFFENAKLTKKQKQAGLLLGISPTFVFNRKTADLFIASADAEAENFSPYPELFWRETLLAAGVQMTPLRTKKPVFAFVRTTGTPGQSPAPRRIAKKPLSPPPNVSVIIPTFNEGEWLKRTIESVLAAKSDLSYEIIVVDDGCTDGSVDAVEDFSAVQVIQTPAPQSGLIVGKNMGGRVARSQFMCFLDSHVLVDDHWLDQLHETCIHQPGESLVTGLVLDVAGPYDPRAPKHLFGYSLKDWTLTTRWHHYGVAKDDRSYPAPLCPGGLMFCRRAHFVRMGGFCPVLRQWGHEDVEISLRNYYFGGDNLVDPRVVVRHYYKNNTDKKPAFRAEFRNTAFNALFIAKTYFPSDHFDRVRDALAAKGNVDALIAEVESDTGAEVSADYRAEFIRDFNDWANRFHCELASMSGQPVPAIAKQNESLQR